MNDTSKKRADTPIHSAYMNWVTSRKDWDKVIAEIFKEIKVFNFVLAVISNTSDGINEKLTVLINDGFGENLQAKLEEYMGQFTMKHFNSIVNHIKKNFNKLSLYRIKDQTVAAAMHVPVNSNIFEIRSDEYKTAKILIIFQKPKVSSEIESMFHNIQKKILKKKKAWFF
ncbi:hypothetical protein KJ966_05795 [bacterium]|nr:hypothetical protein [bacterium]